MFTILAPTIEGFEQEFETLPRAVRAILNLPRRSAQLTNEGTGQVVRVKAVGNTLAEVGHVIHPTEPLYEGETPDFIPTGVSSISVVRFNERPFLRLVANQLKRFTGFKPIRIIDSKGIETVV